MSLLEQSYGSFNPNDSQLIELPKLFQNLNVPTSNQDLVLKPDFKLAPLPLQNQLQPAKYFLGRREMVDMSW